MLTEAVLNKIENRETVRIAVVGGGPSATELVIRLSEATKDPFPISFTIFEPRSELGLGVAWNNETDALLANMRARTLGPSYDEFELIDETLTRLAHPEQGVEYPSRNAVGQALRWRWAEACKHFPACWSFQHVREKAVDVTFSDNVATVYGSGCHSQADIVILAVGNVFRTTGKRYPQGARLLNGWEPAGFDALPKDQDILILGAGLTSIDATIRLLERGHEQRPGSIVWASGSGTLPYVRPRQIHALSPRYLSLAKISQLIDEKRKQGNFLTLDDLLKQYLLELNAQARILGSGFHERSTFMDLYDSYQRTEFRAGGGNPNAHARSVLDRGLSEADKPSLWFSVAKLLDEYTIPVLWNALSADEQARFYKRYRRAFDRFWAPIPKPNALKMKNWLDSGLVQLTRGGVNSRTMKIHPGSNNVCFHRAQEDAWGSRTKKQLHERYKDGFYAVIDATGIPADPADFDSLVLKRLERANYLIPYTRPAGPGMSVSRGYDVDWQTGAVHNARGDPHGWLFALAGSATVGVHRFTNSYLAVSAAADRLATALMRHATTLPRLMG